MKKYLVMILAALYLVLLSACGVEPGPEKTVEAFCSALQEFDLEEAAGYLANGEDDAAGTILSDDAENDFGTEFLEEYYKTNSADMTYTIGEFTVDGDTADVPVSFTYVDASPIITAAMGEYFTQAFALALSSAEPADEEAFTELFVTIFMDKAKTVETEMKTGEVVFSCEKTDGTWTISLTDTMKNELLAVLTGDMTSALEEFVDIGMD